jgi:hypothetical protein
VFLGSVVCDGDVRERPDGRDAASILRLHVVVNVDGARCPYRRIGPRFFARSVYQPFRERAAASWLFDIFERPLMP